MIRLHSREDLKLVAVDLSEGQDTDESPIHLLMLGSVEDLGWRWGGRVNDVSVADRISTLETV